MGRAAGLGRVRRGSGDGAYRLHDPDTDVLVRAATLETQYASLDLGLVDASVIVACERLGETKVATLNREISPSSGRGTATR
jgi:hypothetical protein